MPRDCRRLVGWLTRLGNSLEYLLSKYLIAALVLLLFGHVLLHLWEFD